MPTPAPVSCEDCDKPIPGARLAAMPTATLCRPCQERKDIEPLSPGRSELVRSAIAEADGEELMKAMLG